MHNEKTTAAEKMGRLIGPWIIPGNWTGELAGKGSLSIGNHRQPGKPKLVEFSYLVLPVLLTTPQAKIIPALVMILPGVSAGGPSLIHKGGPSPMVALDAPRIQFSDIMKHHGEQRLKRLQFTLEEKQEDGWPISSWGLSGEFD
jgi:hypothetical protein